MRDWIALARPRQWTKNLLLYVPFLFTVGEVWGVGDDGEGLLLLGRVTLGVVMFSLLSSAGYLFNDARDAATDRMHPKKRLRPIAAGRIAVGHAQQVAMAFAVSGLAVAVALGSAFALAAAAYVCGTVLYSVALRRLQIVDVMAVAVLFVVRVVAGAAAIEVPASSWIIACTFAGALFVASTKRQQDRWLLGSEASMHRYSKSSPPWSERWPAYIAIGAGVMTTGLYACYAAFAENVPPGGLMLLSWPFIPVAAIRYWYLARTRPDRDADEIAFRDPWVLLAIVGFLIVAVAVLAAR